MLRLFLVCLMWWLFLKLKGIVVNVIMRVLVFDVILVMIGVVLLLVLLFMLVMRKMRL